MKDFVDMTIDELLELREQYSQEHSEAEIDDSALCGCDCGCGGDSYDYLWDLIEEIDNELDSRGYVDE